MPHWQINLLKGYKRGKRNEMDPELNFNCSSICQTGKSRNGRVNHRLDSVKWIRNRFEFQQIHNLYLWQIDIHFFVWMNCLNGLNRRDKFYPSSKYLIDGSAFFEGTFGNDFRPHLLHVEHERVQRLLDVRLAAQLTAKTLIKRKWNESATKI